MNKKSIREVGLDSGNQKLIGLHTLRHYFATQLFQSGTALQEIQELLRHKNL